MADNNPASLSKAFRSVYDDTVFFIDGLIEEHKVFPRILDMMRDGNATIELRKRYMLRAIDETWVNIIEDSLPYLEAIIRNPSKFIEEREEVLPVELSRKVSVRTLQHLSQHTNLISRIDGDTIIPKKLLNVFREETLQTYENKFINTLISRLYAFVNRRYEIALKSGHDEKTTHLDFNEEFMHDDAHVKMQFLVEISEPADKGETLERNYTSTTDLWHRIERLNDIVTAYAESEFCRSMGHSYIRPPVMRTNAILKNKNLRQCLTLWQFIESYDGAGYGMLVQEDLEKVDEEYIKELYSTLAMQYMIFRYNIRNEFELDSTLDSKLSDNELKPRIIGELSKLSDSEFDLKDPPPDRIIDSAAKERYGTLTPDDKIMLQSLDIALAAVEEITRNGDEEYYDGGVIPEPEPEPIEETESVDEQPAPAETEEPAVEEPDGLAQAESIEPTEPDVEVSPESEPDGAENEPENVEEIPAE